jgi:glutamyl-tRNA synthetase
VASPSRSPTSKYRGRIAPSPTGYLHIGHARTFWTAFERARDAHGTLILRMEDLDPDRSRPEYAWAAADDLSWLGIRWQEGPEMGGPYAPYVQSRRHLIYLVAWRNLLEGGFIYPCHCSRKDLAAALSAPHENTSARQQSGLNAIDLDAIDDEPIYPATCRPLHQDETAAAKIDTIEGTDPGGFNWRFCVPDGEVVEFTDLHLGPQRFVAGLDFGDFVVWRRDGVPSYQLACVADDAAMAITEVVRGADLLKSTARQILLNRALGFRDPAWYHCSLTVDQNGRRLAKRHDALSLRALRQRGLAPAGVLSMELQLEG